MKMKKTVENSLVKPVADRSVYVVENKTHLTDSDVCRINQRNVTDSLNCASFPGRRLTNQMSKSKNSLTDWMISFQNNKFSEKMTVAMTIKLWILCIECFKNDCQEWNTEKFDLIQKKKTGENIFWNEVVHMKSRGCWYKVKKSDTCWTRRRRTTTWKHRRQKWCFFQISWTFWLWTQRTAVFASFKHEN